MIFNTKGIVLNHIKYKESSIIVRVYTEKFGLQSYIINSVRSAKAKHKIALFQSLTLVDLMVYHKENRDLHKISEVKCDIPFQEIPFKFEKTSIALVLSEIISKCVHSYEDEKLFYFLKNSICTFDLLENNKENFLIIFLYKMSNFLGFSPMSLEEINEQVSHHFQQKNIFLSQENKWFFDKIKDANCYQEKIESNLEQRRFLLNILLKYYQVHIEYFGELKTLPILQEILH